jgi:hypothetical protein
LCDKELGQKLDKLFNRKWGRKLDKKLCDKELEPKLGKNMCDKETE